MIVLERMRQSVGQQSARYSPFFQPQFGWSDSTQNAKG